MSLEPYLPHTCARISKTLSNCLTAVLSSVFVIAETVTAVETSTGTTWKQLLAGPLKPPLCAHGTPCVERTVLKKGPTQGRVYVALQLSCTHYDVHEAFKRQKLNCILFSCSFCVLFVFCCRFYVCSRADGRVDDPNARCNVFVWQSDHRARSKMKK